MSALLDSGPTLGVTGCTPWARVLPFEWWGKIPRWAQDSQSGDMCLKRIHR